MISHRFKCVFVHVPKTAGQSIEHFFKEKHGIKSKERFCEELLIMNNSDPLKGPQRLDHLRSEEYVSYGYLDEQTYQNYFTFGFVRNPWQRLVSEYLYKKRGRDMPFRDFVLRDLPNDGLFLNDDDRHMLPQYDFLFDAQGRQNVDFIGRFENLAESFAEVCTKLGIQDTKLPHKNSSFSPRRVLRRTLKQLFNPKLTKVKKHYTEYYDEELLEYVNNMYAKDIKQFGYVYGE